MRQTKWKTMSCVWIVVGIILTLVILFSGNSTVAMKDFLRLCVKIYIAIIFIHLIVLMIDQIIRKH